MWKEIWKKADRKTKAAIILATMGIILTLVNLFVRNEKVRVVGFCIPIIVLTLDFMVLLEENKKLFERWQESEDKAYHYSLEIRRVRAQIICMNGDFVSIRQVNKMLTEAIKEVEGDVADSDNN